ncbi:MAG: cytochrome P450, partial [Acidimicrobiales bacterium]
ANRDERQFERADEFLLERPVQRHLGLGHGAHFCVGAPLGRAIGRIVWEELLPLASSFEPDTASAQRVVTPNFRGFLRLEVSTG